MPFIDIEQLVQSILADLPPVSFAAKSELPVGASSAVIDADKESQENKIENKTQGAVFITHRVVSAQDVCGKIGSAAKLYVPPNCVITPSAKDEIRKRKIELVVQLTQNAQSDQNNPTESLANSAKIYVHEPCDISKVFVKKIEGFGFGKLESKPTLDAIFDELETAVKIPMSVVLTNQPALVLYNACQHRGLRPIQGTDPLQTVEDIEQLKANLVIVSPQRLGDFKCMEIIRKIFLSFRKSRV